MKGIILLADYFEDTEAIATIDVIRRAGIEVVLISVTKNKHLKTSYNISIEADKLIEQIHFNDYEFLIIPGGSKAVGTLHANDMVTEVIN